MGVGLNVITSNQASKLVQDSAFQVLSEGSLKAVARPAFTLADKSASLDARKYSATKELIFQSVSMAMYFAIITTVFQKGGYKFLKSLPKFKNYDALKGINNIKDFNVYFNALLTVVRFVDKSDFNDNTKKQYFSFNWMKLMDLYTNIILLSYSIYSHSLGS